MKIINQSFEIQTTTQMEFIDVTLQVQEIVDNSGIREGNCLVFIPHATMGIVVNQNEPMLLQDFMRVLYKLVPVDDQYSHDLFELRRSKTADGRSNGHSHCKAMVLGDDVTIPIIKGKLVLTERQSIFAVEFDGARKRDIIVQIIGL